jgi:hypothetical protein
MKKHTFYAILLAPIVAAVVMLVLFSAASACLWIEHALYGYFSKDVSFMILVWGIFTIFMAPIVRIILKP